MFIEMVTVELAADSVYIAVTVIVYSVSQLELVKVSSSEESEMSLEEKLNET